MGRKEELPEVSPWAFLKEDFIRRLPAHYETIHLGDEAAFHNATSDEARLAERPILTIQNSKNKRRYYNQTYDSYYLIHY